VAEAQAVLNWKPVATRKWQPKELEAAFRQHHVRVFAAAYRVTGNAMDAEDVLQTVFLRLARGGSDRLPHESAELEAYLKRAAVNGALDALRKRARHSGLPLDAAGDEPDLAPASTPDPARPLIRERVRGALAEMSPRSAEIFVLRYLEGFSNQEIGALLGTTESTVGVTLFRARAQVRAALEAAGDLEYLASE
jgi:RNA polymerase sigma-70 factor (ECF subfamily)